MVTVCILFALLTSTGVILPGNKAAKEMTRADRELLVIRYTKPDGSEEYDKLDKGGRYTRCIISKGKQLHASCERVNFDGPQWRGADEGLGSMCGEHIVFDAKESLIILEGLKKTYVSQER